MYFKGRGDIIGIWLVGVACKQVDHLRYLNIQLDSEAKRTHKKAMNKRGHSVSFVSVL